MLKVGDIVRIKTWEEMLEDENVHLEGDSLRNINNDSYFVQEMKQYCGKVITINENNLVKYSDSIIYYDTWEFFDWIYTIIGHINELNQSCIIKNRTKVIVEQSETRQKLSLFSNKTPILKEGYIVETKYGIGVVMGNKIRYGRDYDSISESVGISRVYKVNENPINLFEIIGLYKYGKIESCGLDLIWEKPKIEQSLDNLELGTKIKVKFKEDGRIEESIVGNISGKRILIYESIMACLFDPDKHEILEIIK